MLNRAAAGQNPDTRPRETFLFVRVASPSFRALYAGYGAGSWQGVVGIIQNPRSDYWEALVGVAHGLTFGPRQTMIVLLAAADASDSRYGQLYLAPTIAIGPVLTAGTLEICAPLQDKGVFQYYLAPLTAYLAVTPKLQVGAAYVLAAQAHVTTGHALGPSIKIGVPHGSLTLYELIGLQSYRTQSRFEFLTSL
jgi:hypothetical protein